MFWNRRRGSSRRPRVIILGAGYAGRMAAIRLARRRLPAEILLVDARPYLWERIRLHQVAAGQEPQTSPLATGLSRSVSLVVSRLVAIDRLDKLVFLDDRDPLPYDFLVYALGSRTDNETVRGASDHAIALQGPEAANAFRFRAASLGRSGGTILVVGGGLTGIEAAAELAESHPGLSITLATSGRIGADLSSRGTDHVRATLERLGVRLLEGFQARRVLPGRILAADGVVQTFDLCLWSAGFRVPPIAAEAGFAVDETGRMLVDASLRALESPEVLAAGDVARVPGPDGRALRAACATALPMGAHAADVLAALLLGREPPAFRFAYRVRCLSLGRRDGVLQFVDAADRPLERVWTGRLAAWAKERVCRATRWAPALERSLGVRVLSWPRADLDHRSPRSNSFSASLSRRETDASPST